MILTTLRFKRHQNSGTWENGYAIGRDVGDMIVIVDINGEVVPQSGLWNYEILMYPKVFIQHEFE
jgi:hypothetical protein